MFWWHYKSPYRVEDPSKPWPIILWLQGGPVSFLCICVCMCGCIYFYLTWCSYLIRLLYICFFAFGIFWSLLQLFESVKQGASGVGIGNFQEVGPLNTFLKPRNSTWLKKADLLFVVLFSTYFLFNNNIIIFI